MSFNPELLNQQSERVEAFAEKVNFGKANFKPVYKHWPGTKENPLPPVEVDEAVFATLPVESRSIDLTLEIDTDEAGFDAPFKYSRFLQMGQSNWHKIFKKSVESLRGAGSMGKGRYGDTLATINGQYVEIADVEITYTKDGEEKTGGYPKLVRVFATREECLAAKNARFAKSGGTAGIAAGAAAGVAAVAQPTVAADGTNVPPGWTAETWAASIPRIRQELASDKTAAQVAADYAVPVGFIAALSAG